MSAPVDLRTFAERLYRPITIRVRTKRPALFEKRPWAPHWLYEWAMKKSLGSDNYRARRFWRALVMRRLAR